MFVRIRGHSMMPAVKPGEWYWASTPSTIHRGDIVLIRKAAALFVKRVIGLPGETADDKTWQLDSDSFWVLGDARDDSLDSRRWGPVRRAEIIRTIRRRVWPPWFKA